MNPTDHTSELRATLNQETARLSWPELQRHYARGVVIVVDTKLDLVEVAVTFAEDNKARVADWLAQGQLHRASDNDAQRWHQTAANFWAVVVAPWVLVQEISLQ